jgi:hypothetical protein
MFETFLLLILLLIGWYWQDSVAKREIAIKIGRELAQRYQLQLLDDTVACNKLWLGRDSRGHAQLNRFYTFEVSADNINRLECNLQLLGTQLQNWHIPPYFQTTH